MSQAKARSAEREAMKTNQSYADQVMNAKREPCFDNLLKVLRGQKPSRPTLFEFFLNGPLYEKLAERSSPLPADHVAYARFFFDAFRRAGYDYALLPGLLLATGFGFPHGEQKHEQTISINEGGVISDRTSFEKYRWPDPAALDLAFMESCSEACPEGMKGMAYLPGGVLENAIGLVGYETLCFLMVDDPVLVGDIFDAIGSRLDAFMKRCMTYDVVGLGMVNDDWGFKTQTMLSVEDMRRYVFPWHRKIVATIHAAGRPAILHSCGNLTQVMTDIVDDIRFDGKHSYEDTIVPVEEAYERMKGHIAVLGGLDLNFLCRTTPHEVNRRARAMLERTASQGGYALGTGNSVPEYVPQEAYFAMTAAAVCG